MQIRLRAHGFTLIELLVVGGIILLLTGGAVASYNSYNDTQRLRQAALTLKSNLRLAQTKAFSGVKPSGCTTLEGYDVTIFQTSYETSARCGSGSGETEIVTLPADVTLSSTVSPIVFRGLAQGVLTDSTILITLSGRLKDYRITVSPNGDIEDIGYIDKNQ